MPTYRELFDAHRGRLIAKINHFFDDYELHLARVRRDGIRILEIGISGGGSLELWLAYFGTDASVHGVDIDPAAIENCPPGAHAHLGSQIDVEFLHGLCDRHGPFDLIVDDGSHLVEHQIATFEALYPTMSADGLYICEDSFTSYWPEYGGGVGEPGTFVEYAKRKVDELHAFWVDDGSIEATAFTASTRSITILSGAVLFERAERAAPTYDARAGDHAYSGTVAELHESARRTV
ncbi:MAG: class I SAM-dependent methyltransferase [Actinomycetota bacterium]